MSSSKINTAVLPFGLSLGVAGKLRNFAKDRTCCSIAPLEKAGRDRGGRKERAKKELQTPKLTDTADSNSFIHSAIIYGDLILYQALFQTHGFKSEQNRQNLCLRGICNLVRGRKY